MCFIHCRFDFVGNSAHCFDFGTVLFKLTLHLDELSRACSLNSTGIDECSVLRSVKLRFQICSLAPEFCTEEKILKKVLTFSSVCASGLSEKYFRKDLTSDSFCDMNPSKKFSDKGLTNLPFCDMGLPLTLLFFIVIPPFLMLV